MEVETSTNQTMAVDWPTSAQVGAGSEKEGSLLDQMVFLKGSSSRHSREPPRCVKARRVRPASDFRGCTWGAANGGLRDGGLKQIREHLRKKGLFLHFLYFPGVLRTLRPKKQKKKRLISRKGGQTPLKPPFVTPPFAAAQLKILSVNRLLLQWPLFRSRLSKLSGQDAPRVSSRWQMSFLAVKNVVKLSVTKFKPIFLGKNRQQFATKNPQLHFQFFKI